MSTAIQTEARIKSVKVTDEAIVADLVDGRRVSVPLGWSWRLSNATPEQRAHWEIIGNGEGVRWPEVDEDISVEGMFRGTPAKRPSQLGMRVLLDASSLIDLEHGRPVSFTDLEKILRECHARLILTYTSVMEFVAPFERSGNRLALCGQLQQLERLPVGYLREGGIKPVELREAFAAFNEMREYVPIDPYAKRWDDTFGPSPSGMLVNQSLYDLVSLALKGGNPVRKFKGLLDAKLTKRLEQHRKLAPRDQKAIERRFSEEVRSDLTFYLRITPPADTARELANWIYSNPHRCPGYRLAYDWHHELMNNAKEKLSANDTIDRAHVLAVPYVDAITMDRNTASLCRSVTKRLNKKHPGLNYEERIFTSLKDLLYAKL